jgi:hypothetical protein
MLQPRSSATLLNPLILLVGRAFARDSVFGWICNFTQASTQAPGSASRSTPWPSMHKDQ